jgi:lysozyme family protein
MKNNFEHCLEMLLEHEGGFVNHPKDPGGMTNLGVTKAVYDQHLGRESTEAEMRALTPEDVGPIYKSNYWDKARCDDLPLGVDWSVFDWGVNSGMSRPAKALQRIIGVTADGGIGPYTLRAVGDNDSKELVAKMHDARQHFYENLSAFPTFGNGWTRRNKETLEQAVKLIEK